MVRALTCVLMDYDYLSPLACGDVVAKGLELTLVRDTAGAMRRTLADPSMQAGELSFGRYIQRLAASDRGFVGIPFMAVRSFRHGSFFVRRDSGLRAMADLAEKRIGTNEWPATGNTWSRALMRDAGVRIDRIEWLVGSVDGAAPPQYQTHDVFPSYVRPAPRGRTLSEMLLGGELDAVMGMTPSKLHGENSPIVRLLPDYKMAEQEYFRRTAIYPAHHIVGVRREVFDRDPGVVTSLYAALELSKTTWLGRRRRLADTHPWMQAAVEETTQLMGEDWFPSGLEPNRRMIQALLDEEVAQGLIAAPMSIDALFPEFQSLVQREAAKP